MRCEIERVIFLENLTGVIGALPARTTYPVLQNVLIEVTKNKLSMAATDLDSYIRKEITLTSEKQTEPGKVILPGRKLLEACREIGAEKLMLSTAENNIRLQSGPSDFLFASLDPAEYPEPPAQPSDSKLEFPLSVLLETYDLTNFAASRDESRPAFCGLFFEVKEKKATVVATDGYRLAMVKKTGDFSGKFSAIIPPKVFTLFPVEEEKVVVTADPAKIGFAFKNTTVISRLIEGPYPDYERVIPKKCPDSLRANREILTAALRRTSVFAHPVGRLVTFNLTSKELTLFAQSPELGSVTESLSCQYEGENLKIGFNVNYLLEILRHIETEEVLMEFSGPLTAGLIKPGQTSSDIEKLFLLMPIHLD